MIASISFSTITGITALAIVMEQTQGLICRILNTGELGHFSSPLGDILLFQVQQ